MLVFGALKLPFGPVFRHESLALTHSAYVATWLLPLIALAIAFFSGSDTLRAAAIGVSIFLLPLTALGLFISLLNFGSVERETELAVGPHVFSAYTTDYRGALGDYGMEVWRETPVVFGVRVARKLPVGGEGYYFKSLEPIDERCVTVRFLRRRNDGEQARRVCVH